MPKGFKLAAKNEISKEVKERIKAYISPYSTESIYLLLDQSLENSPRVNFPCSSTRSRKNSDISI
jgi:hypothetical protein